MKYKLVAHLISPELEDKEVVSDEYRTMKGLVM